MPRIPFILRGSLSDQARQLSLTTYQPSIILEGLVTGVDNVRVDVFLSGRFTETARGYIARLISAFGKVEELAAESAQARPQSVAAKPGESGRFRLSRLGDAVEFKRQLVDVHVGGLNRAKADGNISVDLLVRLAIIKFLRSELPLQYGVVTERCRLRLKSYEGPRQPAAGKGHELRELFSRFQIDKKGILRRVGQDLFQTLREIDKQTLGKMRRSLFGEDLVSYELFMNRLLFTEDGRDDYLNAEHYVMLGNYERDPDRFDLLEEICHSFLRSLKIAGEDEDSTIDSYLNVPENAQDLLAGGSPDDSTPRGKAQRILLTAWVDALERQNVMESIIASYEVVPLLAEYSPPINAQQLKNALVAKAERNRVETLLQEHARLSPESLNAAVKRVAGCKGSERSKLAGRFLGDFIRYHRDLRRLQAVNAAMDGINIIQNEKLRQLSAINNTLYDILLPEEHKPLEDKVAHHVILKADIRDSSTLTRTLFERGLNPASYFSLNFYEPVNKLLPKYEASKVFIEGDAIILALFEREGEPGFAVGRACVLAREVLEVVRAYNEQSQKAGLPTLELGIGISYQDAAPLYLMDGNSQIMISKALNESDRLSSCNRITRKRCESSESLFSVYAFQTIEDSDPAASGEELLLRFNIGGININEAAFQKLKQEIALQAATREMQTLWEKERVRLYTGVVPVGQGAFRRIVVREGRTARIDPRNFSFKEWTNRKYYELCSHPAIYEFVESTLKSAAASSSS